MLVQIRYNTLCNDDHLYWRILIDGVERTCSHIIINVPTQTTRDDVFDDTRHEVVNKHHITCTPNKITWFGDSVTLD